MNVMGEFTAKEVCKLLDLEYTRLDYWARSKFFEPSISKAQGSGSKRLYSFLDLVTLKIIKALRDEGITVQKLKKVIKYMRQKGNEVENPFAGSVFITDGKKVFELTSEPNVVVDILNNGQLVWVIAIDRVVKQLRSQVVRLEEIRYQPEQPVSGQKKQTKVG